MTPPSPIARQIHPIGWAACSSRIVPTIANAANPRIWMTVSSDSVSVAIASINATRAIRTNAAIPSRPSGLARRARPRDAPASGGGSAATGARSAPGGPGSASGCDTGSADLGDHLATDPLELLPLVAIHQVDVELVDAGLRECVELLDDVRHLTKDTEPVRDLVADEPGVRRADL